MSGDQTTRQWRVLVGGGAQTDVRPGERVEIGRKPIRPLPDDDIPRFEVADATRSMSKRHAVFSVSEGGAATLRDLGSTNGSYMVRNDGSLVRLPEGVDFPLPTSPMRAQFGDVTVDFVRVETIEPAQTFTVPDLFNYAPSHSRQEPDAADMSVDDILDLRAGEPTTMFQSRAAAAAASGAAQPVLQGTERNEVETEAGQPEANPQPDFFAQGDEEERPADSLDSMPLAVGGAAPEEPVQEPARDLFVDAMATGVTETEDAGQSAAEPSQTPEPSQAAEPEQTMEPGQYTESGQAAEPAQTDAIAQAAEATQPVQTAQPAEAAGVAAAQQVESTQTAGATQSTATVQPAETAQTAPTAQTAEPAAEPAQAAPVQTAPAQAMTPADIVFTPLEAGEGEVGADNAAQSQVQPAAAGPSAEETAVFTPAFEPGSVFDRVSRGELKAAAPAIEVDGMTSEDAKHSTDFRLQYEMARHEELQPFLAMNPALYDDLYAWLAAQGNRDIDEALSHNEGYREYRAAVGK